MERGEFGMQKAEDIMTRDPEVCPQDASVLDAVTVMYENDCGIVPVVDESGTCQGVVTDRDICLDVILNRKNPESTPLRDVMTTDVLGCTPDTPLDTVVTEMRDRQVRRMVVLDNQQKCIGVISEGDIARRAEERRVVGDLVSGVTEDLSPSQ
jgi:CBS domain-containing protein